MLPRRQVPSPDVAPRQGLHSERTAPLVSTTRRIWGRECALADLIAPNASHACLLVAGATGKPARGSAFHGVYFLTSQEEEE